MYTNQKIESLWNEFRDKSWVLAELLDSGSVSLNALESKLDNLKSVVNDIRTLQRKDDYDGTRLVRLPDGSRASADIAIYGGLMFFKELEATVLAKSTKHIQRPKYSPPTPQTAPPTPNIPLPDKKIDKVYTRSPEFEELMGIVFAILVFVFFVLAVLVAVNTTLDKINEIVGIVLGIFLLSLSFASGVATYKTFKEL